jgi:hypothetical protein
MKTRLRILLVLVACIVHVGASAETATVYFDLFGAGRLQANSASPAGVTLAPQRDLPDDKRLQAWRIEYPRCCRDTFHIRNVATGQLLYHHGPSAQLMLGPVQENLSSTMWDFETRRRTQSDNAPPGGSDSIARIRNRNSGKYLGHQGGRVVDSPVNFILADLSRQYGMFDWSVNVEYEGRHVAFDPARLAADSPSARIPAVPPQPASEQRPVVTTVGPAFGSPPILGEIKMFAGTYAPSGYALCQGQLLSIRQFVALFSLLGTQYGGDGKQTFALPDLSHLERQLKVRYIIAVDGTFPPRQ